MKTKSLLKQGEVKALFETLAVVNVYMVIYTLSDTLAKAEIETLNERKARRIRSGILKILATGSFACRWTS